MALVRTRTIPTELPPPVGEVGRLIYLNAPILKKAADILIFGHDSCSEHAGLNEGFDDPTENIREDT